MSSERITDRIKRLNELVLCLTPSLGTSPTATPPCIPRDELLEKLGCAGRTLERDIIYLFKAHKTLIVFNTNKNGYELKRRGNFLLHIDLSGPEAAALAAGVALTQHFLPHLQKASETLGGKVRAYLTEELAKESEQLAKNVAISFPVSPLDQEHFKIILKSIHDKGVLKGYYTLPYAPQIQGEHVEISPWGVFFRAHAWYLWAWAHRKQEERVYRISRFKFLHDTKEAYVTPPHDKSVIDFAQNAWYGFSGGLAGNVAIRVLPPPLSRVVSETQWHATQTIETCGDGSIILRAQVPNIDEVARWVLASSPNAVVLEPLELKERVKNLALEMLKRHAED